MQGIWQVHYQILLIIFPKEFIELNEKFDTMIKNGEICGIKYKLNILEYSNFKDDLVKHKCLSFNKSYQRKFDEKLRERFFDICKCFNHNNKFIILSLKCVYPYEYIDDWGKT